MKRGLIGSILLLGVVLVGIAIIRARNPTNQIDTTVQGLLAQEAVLNEKCSDGSAANADEMQATQKICDERDRVYSELTARGWCFGEGKQLEYQKDWQPCHRASKMASVTGAVEDTVQYDQHAAQKAERLEAVYADARGCMRRIAIVQLKIGNRSRSNIIAKMASICGAAYVGERLAYGYVQPKAEMDAYLWKLANKQLDLALDDQ